MPVLLAALLVPVVVYCLARAVAPASWGGRGEHRREVDVWHALMGGAMVAMLAGVLTRPLAVASLSVATTGLCWGVVAVERRAGSAAHVRLVVGSAAMALMTLPLATPAEASTPAGGMAGMSTGVAATPLLVVLLVALAVVAAVRVPVVARRSAGPVQRLDAGCDVAMAGAMAAMLAALL